MSILKIFPVSLMLLISLVRCSSGPEPIRFGKDQCEFCRMTIANPKFGAELVTAKGRIFKYDAAECLINHLENDAPDYQLLLAIAYDHPKKLYPVDSLVFVISPEYRSPMGANLAAFADEGKVAPATSDSTLRWEEVRKRLSVYQE